MNINQKKLLFSLSAAIGLIILFPPYIKYGYKGNIRSNGFSFILDMPYSSAINFTLLISEMMGVLIIGTLLFFVLKNSSENIFNFTKKRKNYSLEEQINRAESILVNFFTLDLSLKRKDNIKNIAGLSEKTSPEMIACLTVYQDIASVHKKAKTYEDRMTLHQYISQINPKFQSLYDANKISDDDMSHLTDCLSKIIHESKDILEKKNTINNSGQKDIKKKYLEVVKSLNNLGYELTNTGDIVLNLVLEDDMSEYKAITYIAFNTIAWDFYEANGDLVKNLEISSKQVNVISSLLNQFDKIWDNETSIGQKSIFAKLSLPNPDQEAYINGSMEYGPFEKPIRLANFTY